MNDPKILGKAVAESIAVECEAFVNSDRRHLSATTNTFKSAAFAIRSLLAEIEGMKVPDGWKLVPVEPTGEMTGSAIKHPYFEHMEEWRRNLVATTFCLQIWDSMIAVSPEPPK